MSKPSKSANWQMSNVFDFLNVWLKNLLILIVISPPGGHRTVYTALYLTVSRPAKFVQISRLCNFDEIRMWHDLSYFSIRPIFHFYLKNIFNRILKNITISKFLKMLYKSHEKCKRPMLSKANFYAKSIFRSKVFYVQKQFFLEQVGVFWTFCTLYWTIFFTRNFLTRIFFNGKKLPKNKNVEKKFLLKNFVLKMIQSFKIIWSSPIIIFEGKFYTNVSKTAYDYLFIINRLKTYRCDVSVKWRFYPRDTPFQFRPDFRPNPRNPAQRNPQIEWLPYPGLGFKISFF